MKLEFGKPVMVGNYTITKIVKSLSRKQVKELRRISGVPEDVQKHLERAKLPYIKVQTASGSWGVEFVMGTSMYDALDDVHVVVDDSCNRQLYGVEAKNVEAMIVAMLADTTTVGDYEYNVAKQKLLQEYLDRATKAKMDEESKKEASEIEKENEEAAREVLDAEEHKTMILDMAERVRKEG
jgi:hypothetical protein